MGQQLLNLVKSCNDKIKKYAKQLVRNDDWLASGAAHSIQYKYDELLLGAGDASLHKKRC